ncbi:LysR family transcriptional regulator [Nocardioides renjunii]|uniref:LysR family transcriptional regulator n=1 Tax=Nocardioides renjunii TaxID=3095075 RepID=UPI002AFF49F1|nr:LysR family transcriptional regulator [Nocardioides sp. S-34]WQQ23822.1 LysR family transcriptional regulator [Nocardioides sp. S-34]
MSIDNDDHKGDGMERRQLEFFLAIAEAGSFTRAAQVLHIAQPSLSHSMRTLEAELGSPLFERHGRGVRLTASGEALLGPARRTVRSFGLAASAVRAVTDGDVGRLRVVSSTSWAVHPLVELIGEFRRLRPRVRFEVTDPAARTVVLDQVRTGQVDFGLVDGTPPAGALASLELAEQQLLAVLPQGSGKGLTTTVEELQRHGLIGTPRGTALRDLLDQHLEAAGHATEVMVETAHVASVVPLVLSGAGAAVLPEGMAVDAATKGARVARLEPETRAAVSLVWRATGPEGVAADFLELVREHRADRSS